MYSGVMVKLPYVAIGLLFNLCLPAKLSRCGVNALRPDAYVGNVKQ